MVKIGARDGGRGGGGDRDGAEAGAGDRDGAGAGDGGRRLAAALYSGSCISPAARACIDTVRYVVA